MGEEKQEIKIATGYIQTIGARCPHCLTDQVFFKHEIEYKNFIRECFRCKNEFKIGEIK